MIVYFLAMDSKRFIIVVVVSFFPIAFYIPLFIVTNQWKYLCTIYGKI